MASSMQPDSTALDHLRQWQVAAWQRGERLLVEQLISNLQPLSITDDLLLDLVCAEIWLREEAAEKIELDEYIGRFPHLEESLRRQFEVNQLMGSLTSTQSVSILISECASPNSSTGNRSKTEVANPAGASRFPELAGYEILSELGRGGMGVVYLARHLQLNRTVALKMIRDSALASPTVRERFRVEAKAVARLKHRGIVQIYDFNDTGDFPYFSLEYLPEGNLSEWVHGKQQSINFACRLVEKLAQALDHAHREGIVHRDLKPANVLLARYSTNDSVHSAGSNMAREPSDSDSFDNAAIDHEPKISDFGLAKSLVDNEELTHSAAMLGTCAYMSPEQAWGRSRDVGPATDIHALGLILYELITGVAPFQSPSIAESLDRVRFLQPPLLSQSRSDVPPELDAICRRCLEKEPAQRYQSAGDLAEDLRHFIENKPVRRLALPVRNLRSAALAVATISAVLLILVLRNQLIDRSRSDSVSPDPPPAVTSIAPIPPRTIGEPFAILVGVRSYRLPDQSIDLEFTESDVDELSRILFRHGFPRKNIRLLTQWNESDNAALAPTGSNIRAQFRLVLAQCIPDDTVIVAVTGLGGDLGTPPMYCYLPADGRPNETTSLMSLAEFYELFRECPAQKKLLLVDTCQTVVADPIHWPTTAEPPAGMAVFFACAPNEPSYEHPSLRHGVFSYHVLRGLDGAADSDHDSIVDLGELARYVSGHVREFVATSFENAAQSPYLISNLPANTPIIRLNTK
ncbi:MAG: protein kinase [Planctomycetota bacterium]